MEEDLKELTNFIKALMKQLEVSPDEFISFLKVVNLSQYSHIQFELGELEISVNKGYGGLKFEVEWERRGVKRSIEYDLTPISSIAKLISQIKEEKQ
ncbi:MAG: hypothetical protein ACP5KE_05725 [Candidatus Methanodesulfokora sp.]|jgi:hypothetical protein